MGIVCSSENRNWRQVDITRFSGAPIRCSLVALCRHALRPRPNDLKLAELLAEIESFDERHARIRFTGRWKADWVHDANEHSIGSATADGFAIYNLEKKTIRLFLMIFDGTYSYTTGQGQKPRTQNSSAVVRWRLEGDAE